MGECVERQTGKLSIRNEVLFVEIKSAPLRADLMLQRTELVKKLNAKVGALVIKDINFI
jgi:predicted nucleic acid-binding Zn ribbon protein